MGLAKETYQWYKEKSKQIVIRKIFAEQTAIIQVCGNDREIQMHGTCAVQGQKLRHSGTISKNMEAIEACPPFESKL